MNPKCPKLASVKIASTVLLELFTTDILPSALYDSEKKIKINVSAYARPGPLNLGGAKWTEKSVDKRTEQIIN